MKRSAIRSARSRRGLTLVELVLSAGLLAILLAAVFQIVRQFMGVWEKSEVRRMQVEESTGVSELLAGDLAALEPGPRGDLLAEWVFFDHDLNGTAETKWPRVRLVRHASPAELARLQAGEAESARLVGEGLIEVVWTVLPLEPSTRDEGRRALGALWRGERVYGPARGADVSMFDETFLSRGGAPRAGAAQEVTGGVLWLGMQFATQTTILRDGWRVGREPGDAVASWDAWDRERPNSERHVWNDTGEFLPKVSDTPLLPRRVRLELELEQASDLKRRTKLSAFVNQQEGSFEVDDPSRVPEAGAHVLIDAEWMQVTSVSGRWVSVKRGARGTTPAAHENGAVLHYGRTMVREVPIATHREDWNL
jgi:hypothetical protein